MSSALLISAPEALAVDRYPLRQNIYTGLLAKGGHKTHESGMEGDGSSARKTRLKVS